MARPKPDQAAADDVLRRLGLDAEKVRRETSNLENPVLIAFASLLGVDLESARRASREALASLDALAAAPAVLGQLGWAVVDRLPSETYGRAVAMVADGANPARIDGLLTTEWNRDRGVRLHGTYGPLHWLYAGDDGHETAAARGRLLDRALTHHRARRYEASILILLTQIDGITFDMTGNNESFFYDGERLPYEHTASVAGLPGNLAAVRSQLKVDGFAVSRAGLWQRHPILHGRELAYDTRINSTKTWALLCAVIEWLRGAKADLSEPARRSKGRKGPG